MGEFFARRDADQAKAQAERESGKAESSRSDAEARIALLTAQVLELQKRQQEMHKQQEAQQQAVWKQIITDLMGPPVPAGASESRKPGAEGAGGLSYLSRGGIRGTSTPAAAAPAPEVLPPPRPGLANSAPSSAPPPPGPPFPVRHPPPACPATAAAGKSSATQPCQWAGRANDAASTATAPASLGFLSLSLHLLLLHVLLLLLPFLLPHLFVLDGPAQTLPHPRPRPPPQTLPAWAPASLHSLPGSHLLHPPLGAGSRPFGPSCRVPRHERGHGGIRSDDRRERRWDQCRGDAAVAIFRRSSPAEAPRSTSSRGGEEQA
ncbi:hypothetical protein Naga_100322g1 [Nannochloropsis gaditana]|uniref:Uncharacterized protein n=1 Tax=Nannochloropsis gaditana TaxID=72520 RepID=W7TWU7_9STRA|nr:hypothetical protein Naga_100322g1 [Nannochloropsis gaditana]